jgi:uncharacterized protein (DUF4415 family)
VRWTWSLTKNRDNKRKHGLSFETAQLVRTRYRGPIPFHMKTAGKRLGSLTGLPSSSFTLGRTPTMKPGASSVHERRPRTKGGRMKKVNASRLTAKQRAELEALAALPDHRIDTADIPEVRDWSDAKRGLFYRPVKKQLTLRIDADVIAWFKNRTPKGQGYQTQMNMALRDHIRRQARARKAG